MSKEKYGLEMQGAIFDLDGTLFDSMWVWDQVDLDFLGKRVSDYFKMGNRIQCKFRNNK